MIGLYELHEVIIIIFILPVNTPKGVFTGQLVSSFKLLDIIPSKRRQG